MTRKRKESRWRRDRSPLRWWAVPTALVGIAVLVGLLSPSPSIAPMDDTYIQLVFGESLISGSPLSFNAGVPSSGFTGPLWLIPSAVASLFGSTGAPVALMVFSLLCAAAALVLAGWPTGPMLLLLGPLFFHASSGMETGAAVLFVVLLWRTVRDDKLVRWRPWLLAGAFLTRPELAVLALPLVLVTWRRGWKALLSLLLPSLLLGGLWMYWNLHAAGHLLPSTFYAKAGASWLVMAGAGLPGLIKGLLLSSILLPFMLVMTVKDFSKGEMCRDRSTGIALASFPVLLLVAALLTQPNSWFQMRYYVPALAAILLASGHWIVNVQRWKSNAIILSLSMLPGLIVFGARRAHATADVAALDVSPAAWLAENAPEDASVAAADIGAVKWITDLHVLDLDGLVTPERMPGDGIADWDWIQDRADYLLAFPEQYSDLLKDGIGSLEFLEGFGTPKSIICGEDSIAIWAIR